MARFTSGLLATLLALSAPSLASAQDATESTVGSETTSIETVLQDRDVTLPAPETQEFYGAVAPVEEEDLHEFEPRRDYHFTAVAGIDTPLLHFEDGYFAPLVKVELYTELGESPFDLLGTITTSGASLALTRRDEHVDISVAPFANYVVHANHLDYFPDGTRDHSKEVAGSEFGGEIKFSTDEENTLSGSIAHQFAFKTYGFPEEEETLYVPEDHFLHRTIAELQVQNLTVDKPLNRIEGLVAKAEGTYDLRPNFDSTVPGFENHEHSVQLAAMLGAYLIAGDFNLHAEVRATQQFGTDIYNAHHQGSMLSATAPGPGMFYKEHRQSTSLQGNLRFGWLIENNYHLQLEPGVLMFPATNTVEGAEQATQRVLPSVALRFDAKVAGVVPIGLRLAYSPFSPRSADTAGGANSGGLELLAYVAIGLGKTHQE